jgi:hypothetical protein
MICHVDDRAGMMLAVPLDVETQHDPGENTHEYPACLVEKFLQKVTSLKKQSLAGGDIQISYFHAGYQDFPNPAYPDDNNRLYI